MMTSKPHNSVCLLLLLVYYLVLFLSCAPQQPTVRPLDTLAITVYPNVGFEPFEATARIRHVPHIDDRSLDIGFFCGDQRVQGSTWSLNGDAEPKYATRSYVLDACMDDDSSMIVYLTITHADGHQDVAYTKIIVHSR